MHGLFFLFCLYSDISSIKNKLENKDMSKKDEMLEEKKKSLFALGNEFVELLELSEDGDISEEEYEEKIQALTDQLSGKMDGWLKVAYQLKTRGEGKIAYAKAEAEAIDKIKKNGEADVKHAKRMYDMVLTTMELQGMKAFKGDLMSATIRTGNSSVEYDDIEDIPSEYLIPQDPKVDTTALKIYLKSLEENGESCEFARLKYSKSLLVK